MDFSELFSPVAIAANWTEAASNRVPYLGEALFPAKKQAGLDLKWIKGAKGVPISLMPTAFDAKATFRDRIGVEKLETEMPFFREGFKIKERDRQDILRAQSSNDPYVAAAIARVFDDANELIEGANVVPERERMQLLFPENGNAGIVIKANGVDYTYNYDPNGEWKTNNYFTTDWATSPSTADPFNDIQTAKDAIIAKTGTEVRVAVMNSVTFKLLRTNNAIKNRYLTTNGLSLGYLTDREIIEVLKDAAGLDGGFYPNYSMLDETFAPVDGQAYDFVAQIRLAATGSHAPRRAGGDSSTVGTDYVVYPMQVLNTPGVVTGVATVKTTPADAGTFYNLLGQPVKNPAAGIYIRDGKKVIVR